VIAGVKDRNDEPLLTCLPLAICGRLPVGKGFLGGNAVLVGAAICPAFGCGTDRWPLAIMLSADQVPVRSTQSRCCNGYSGVS
jgi:hypothetical protein